MRILAFIGRGGAVGAAGIGVTTAPSDLAAFLYSVADWVDAGGRIEMILWGVIGVFGIWMVFDILTWAAARRKARTSKPEKSRLPISRGPKMSVWGYHAQQIAEALQIEPRRTREDWDAITKSSQKESPGTPYSRPKSGGDERLLRQN